MAFIELFPPGGVTLEPLVAPEFTAHPFRDTHARGEGFGVVHALGVYDLDEVTVTGYGHLFRRTCRLAGRVLVPRYIERRIAAGEIVPEATLHLPAREIKEPAVAFMGYGQRIYGHALIELAPKIVLALRALGPGLPFVLPSDAPAWFRRLIAFAGAERFIEYEPARENLLLRRAFIPTMPSGTASHPAIGPIFAELAERAPTTLSSDGRGGHDWLFVSRREAEVTSQRQLRNRAEVEALAEQRGFTIVRPEALTPPEQATLFRRASIIVGEAGSALHNAVYCRPGTIIGAIGIINPAQSAIAGACGLRQSYLDPEGDLFAPDGYSVDPDRLDRWLGALAADQAEVPLTIRPMPLSAVSRLASAAFPPRDPVTDGLAA